MNLHNLARRPIASINPEVKATLCIYTGYDNDASGQTAPRYDEIANVSVQMQPASSAVLQAGGFEQASIVKEFWLTGKIETLARVHTTGGDLIKIGADTYKLTAADIWTPTAGWVHATGVLQ